MIHFEGLSRSPMRRRGDCKYPASNVPPLVVPQKILRCNLPVSFKEYAD